MALQAEWANLLSPFIQRYIKSMCRRITAYIAQNGGHIFSFISLVDTLPNETSPVMQLCLTKLSVILESESFNEIIIAATSNFQGMSAKNDSLLQIEEITRIYASSKYLDRNV